MADGLSRDAREERQVVKRTIVLPAYNEQGSIEGIVRRCVAVCEQRPDTFEIIVVDNASTDDTASIVERVAATDSRVLLIKHPENRLYAGSCRSGTAAARGERVFIMDSDGQHRPEDVWTFDAALDRGFDLVFGDRTQRAEPRTRLVLSRILWLMCRVMIGFDLKDVNCGMRAMSRRYVDGLHIDHRVNFVNPELFVRAKERGLNIGEVEVVQQARAGGVSSHELNRLGRIFGTVARYLLALRRDLRAKTSVPGDRGRRKVPG